MNETVILKTSTALCFLGLYYDIEILIQIGAYTMIGAAIAELKEIIAE